MAPEGMFIFGQIMGKVALGVNGSWVQQKLNRRTCKSFKIK